MRDFFFFSSRRRHTRYWRDWSSDVCSSDLLAPEQDPQRVAREAPRLSEPVVEVSHVVLLHELGVVTEDGDRRRRRLDLGGVVELDLATSRLRWLAPRDELPQPLVDLVRLDALFALLGDAQQQVEYALHSLPGQRRREDERDEPEEGRFLPCLLLEAWR